LRVALDLGAYREYTHILHEQLCLLLAGSWIRYGDHDIDAAVWLD
jgi:hypothetical protein